MCVALDLGLLSWGDPSRAFVLIREVANGVVNSTDFPWKLQASDTPPPRHALSFHVTQSPVLLRCHLI